MNLNSRVVDSEAGIFQRRGTSVAARSCSTHAVESIGPSAHSSFQLDNSAIARQVWKESAQYVISPGVRQGWHLEGRGGLRSHEGVLRNGDEMTTHEQGRVFEQEVRELLELHGYDVGHEILCGTKKVDMVASTRIRNQIRRTAVECKNESRALHRERLIKIWLEYEELYNSGDIEELLVVTAVPAAPGALAWAAKKPAVSVETYEELLQSVFDLTQYTKTAMHAFERSPDQVSKYYVEPYSTDTYYDYVTPDAGGESNVKPIAKNRLLIDSILDWVSDAPTSTMDLNRPLAILGSYGIGKSTFALNLTSRLASIARTDPRARTPVLLRLGDISYEQKLEGLLGTHFTATNRVKNYSFNAFIELVRLHRFVLIFDGFDEMKQMITWTEFRHNIGEINRLVKLDPKVIILGRPNSFESDEEQAEVLHGMTPGAYKLFDASGVVDYQERHMMQLRAHQIEEFLRAYLRHVLGDASQFEYAWQHINSPELRDLAKRPVQLRMLAEILPARPGVNEPLDIPTLYDMFINEIIRKIIQREEEKLNRLRFSGDERKRFLSDLAYWTWTSSDARFVVDEEIPDEIIKPYVNDDPISLVRRDLLAAAPIERRLNERIRFPHRSIQEFLVAEQVWFRLSCDELSINEYDSFANDEVAEFVQLLRRRDKHANVIGKILRTYRGMLSLRAVKSIFGDLMDVRSPSAQISHSESRSPWELFLASAPAVWDRHFQPESPVAIAGAKVPELSPLDAGLLKLYLILTTGAAWRDADNFHTGLDQVLNSLLYSVGLDETVKSGKDMVKVIDLGKVDGTATFVGDRRQANLRIGEPLLARKTRRPKSWESAQAVQFVGEPLNFRWFYPETIVIAMAVCTDTNTVDFRRAERMLVNRLMSIAFLTDWAEYTKGRPTIEIAPKISDGVTARAKALIQAFDEYCAIRPRAADSIRMVNR